MTSTLVALCFRANDPRRLARFWASALRWELADEADELRDATGFLIRFPPAPATKSGKNRIHLDLTTTSSDDQTQTVETLVALGASHVDIGQSPDEPHVVLTAAGGGLLLEQGTRVAVGLGSGRGDRHSRAGRHRSVHHLGAAEVDRLVSLGATVIDIGDVDWVVMTDPDGNEFRVVA